MRALIACLCTTAFLAHSYGRAPVYERPIHAIVLCFVTCAIALIIADRLYPQFLRRSTAPRGSQDHGTVLQAAGAQQYKLQEQELGSEQEPEPFYKNRRLTYSRQLPLVAVAVLLLSARLELHRRIYHNAQCTSRRYEVFLPFILSLNDWRQQQRIRFSVEERPDEGIYDGILSAVKTKLVRPAWRYVPTALLLCIACYTITGLWISRTSTYICPIASGEALTTPRLQQLALLIDILLAIVAEKVGLMGSGTPGTVFSPSKSYGSILLGVAFCWAGYAVILFIFRPEYGGWLLLLDLPSRSGFLLSLLWHLVLFCVFFMSTAHCVMQFGVFFVSAFLTAALTILPGLSLVWYARLPFPPMSKVDSTWAFFAAVSALWILYQIRRSVNTSDAPRSNSWVTIPFIILIVILCPGFFKSNRVHFHPIDLLMFDARGQHDDYVQYATRSKNLQTAVDVYRGRYQSEPPPGFDRWWEYAQNRSVTIVDDFDQIYLDLLPFRTVSPADLRRQTWEMVSNPWNEVSGISIRNGRAEVQENSAPTHRWMFEGVAVLINQFAQYLPDMDLAFNPNDECRVAISHDQMTRIKRHTEMIPLNGTSTWNPNRAADWPPVTGEEYTETSFENWSFRNSFAKYGSNGCGPGTAARSASLRPAQSHLCTECAEPHSVSVFVKDWSLAADPCHQPDLAHLHGFYLSPAAFKTSRQLLPVFSQSKVRGFNDILYPSAWNYMDKARYAPSGSSGVYGTDGYSAGYPDMAFADKENKLYWRGTTTEGVSDGSGVWQGMTRQRLVHMANNLTTSYHDYTTVLLPEPNAEDGYRYRSMSARSLLGLGMQTDIRMVDHIARCGGIDCYDQEQEFGFVAPIDFQAHWKYRYLFDMDGAGFSGRFLPFLLSRSVPFKSGIFREWYDTRITAWRHFIPQDIRLHGLWSTLAYFAGVNGIVDGKPVVWEGHPKEAEQIAEEGRVWAERVLRKEDMEVYFFRLLSEWGRLTDDRRDELGFPMK